MTTSFITETADQELDYSDLTAITGGGKGKLKKALKKAGQAIEKVLGDGDGKHEISDYKDEVIWVIKKLSGSTVYNPPGQGDPRPGVEY